MRTLECAGLRASFCLVITVALGSAVICARNDDEQNPRSVEILVSAGHPATIQVNRSALRVDHAKHRTTHRSAYVLVAADHIGLSNGRGDALVEHPWTRSFDDVPVQSGRSPPVSLS